MQRKLGIILATRLPSIEQMQRCALRDRLGRAYGGAWIAVHLTNLKEFLVLKFFRVASFIEGMSYLLILCVTLGFISRDYVSTLGMGHGVLFIFYLVLSVLVTRQQGWSLRIWLLLFLSAFIPFAFVPVEMFLQKELRKNAGRMQYTS